MKLTKLLRNLLDYRIKIFKKSDTIDFFEVINSPILESLAIYFDGKMLSPAIIRSINVDDKPNDITMITLELLAVKGSARIEIKQRARK